MMTAGMSTGLIGRLAIILVLKVCGRVVMGLPNRGVMCIVRDLNRGCGMSRRVVGAACRRRKCRQSLQRQGQHQQPDGNQSRMFHGAKFYGYSAESAIHEKDSGAGKRFTSRTLPAGQRRV